MAKKEGPVLKIEREYNVPLRKEFMKVPKYKRAKKALTALKQFLARHMKPETLVIGKHLNQILWKHGIRNPPHHVKVVAKKFSDGKVVAELEGAPEEKKIEKKEAGEKEQKKEEVKEKGAEAGKKPEEEKPAEEKKAEKPVEKEKPAEEQKAEKEKPAEEPKKEKTAEKPEEKKKEEKPEEKTSK